MDDLPRVPPDAPGDDAADRRAPSREDEDQRPGEGEDELPTDVVADPETRIDPDLRRDFDVAPHDPD